MSNTNIAQKIGYQQAFKAITVGLIIAYAIMSTMAGPTWIFQFPYLSTILFAIAMIYLSGYLFGCIAGRVIIIKKWPAFLVGVIIGFLVVWSATFAASIIAFTNEGLKNGNSASEAFHDYIIKPVGLVTVYGFIPIIIVGLWFGISVKMRVHKINSA